MKLTASNEQVYKIDGADLIVTELTFGGPFTPLSFEIAKPNKRP